MTPSSNLGNYVKKIDNFECGQYSVTLSFHSKQNKRRFFLLFIRIFLLRIPSMKKPNVKERKQEWQVALTSLLVMSSKVKTWL